MVLSCHVFCSLLLHCESKKGLIMLKTVGINNSSRARKPLCTFSFIQFPRNAYPFFNCVSTFHWLVLVHHWHIRFPEPSQVRVLIYYDPMAPCFINVENCKLNPESPNLRFVSRFSNVNIKGQKSAIQWLWNGDSELWVTCHWNSTDRPIFVQKQEKMQTKLFAWKNPCCSHVLPVPATTVSQLANGKKKQKTLQWSGFDFSAAAQFFCSCSRYWALMGLVW